ncbi:phosphoadenosine phosphosulfate reductase family protein [uncultured Dysosmobacter sp.]|uniref:phosphoadenosine phosphosulfate reductase family protein n=1 Tax=uncultured Dysosmobacter sp. TaxID=2591384 RepID=UPI002627E563|nr:phosphoadenosine phosphosulfate reductase family protein [uncultured Dysosmobacter sp.]
MSEAVYTRRDLSIMQAWPLARKIQVTQAKIMEWYYHYDGKVAVSFSGGKDSTVLLDMARRAFPDIPAVFVDTGLEYPEIRDFVKSVPNVTWLRPEIPFPKVIETYGYPVISKEVAHRIYYARRGSTWANLNMCGLDGNGKQTEFNKRFLKWRFLLDAPFPISALCCTVMKKTPIHRFSESTGTMQIVGTMACESVRRQNAYLKSGCNAFHKREPTSQPMSFWLERDVLEYLRLTGLPYASIYGEIVEDGEKLITTGAQRTGCMFCMFGAHLEKNPNRFQRMALTHPKQYDYCIHKLGCGTVLDYIGVPYTAGKEVAAHEPEVSETP